MSKRRIALLLAMTMLCLLCLTACKDKHTHTYAEEFSYDTENHWRQATCEHTDEKSDLGAHKFGETGDKKCKTCGYQAVKLQVKTASENVTYTRTQQIHSLLRLGLVYGDDSENVQWVQAEKHNIESYTVQNGTLTVKVAVVVSNIKHTAEITIPLEESPVGVEAFFSQEAGSTCMLNGVVVGFSTTGNYNEVVLADKQTGRLVSVTKMGAGKLLYGGYSLPDIQVGDEIIIPVTLVKEKQAETTANSAKVNAEFQGSDYYRTAVVSKGNSVTYPTDVVVIDSQADLETFLSAANRENNHYKLVKLKGKLSFVMDSSYENYNFWFSEKQAVQEADIQIDKITPSIHDPSLYYTLGTSFSQLIFGEPYHAAINYKAPMSAQVEITAVYLGGCTTFGQFLILDQSWVTK